MDALRSLFVRLSILLGRPWMNIRGRQGSDERRRRKTSRMLANDTLYRIGVESLEDRLYPGDLLSLLAALAPPPARWSPDGSAATHRLITGGHTSLGTNRQPELPVHFLSGRLSPSSPSARTDQRPTTDQFPSDALGSDALFSLDPTESILDEKDLTPQSDPSRAADVSHETSPDQRSASPAIEASAGRPTTSLSPTPGPAPLARGSAGAAQEVALAQLWAARSRQFGSGAGKLIVPAGSGVSVTVKPAAPAQAGPAPGNLPPSHWTAQAAEGPETSDNTILFQLRSGQEGDLSRVLPVLNRYHATPTPTRITGLYSVRCAPADQQTLLSLLAAQPAVRVAEPMAFAQAAEVTPRDPDFSAGKMWGLNGTNGINATQAWDVGRGSTKVTVAVLDSGTDYQHPDLYRNIWVNQGEIPATIRSQLTDVDSDGLITFWDLNNAVNQGTGKITDLNSNGYIDAGDILQPFVPGGIGGWADSISNDGDSYVDDLVGWNFVTNTNTPFDDFGHGTHVAGTIAATGDNNTGVVGVNWRSQVMTLKVLNSSGAGAASSLASGIEYAYKHGARIANASLTFPPGTSISGPGMTLVRPQIQNAASQTFPGQGTGMIFVAAAGNLIKNTDSEPIYPASLPEGNILSVAATDVNGKLAPFSNYGLQSVDVAAPGVNIWSTTPGNYFLKSGTSMASPHVAGLAALLLEQHPTWTVADVINRIKNTGTPAASLAGKTVTGKIINAAAALQDGTQPTMTHVDLGDWVNRQAFIQDGQPFSNTIGVELSGTTSRALSANQLGDPVVWPGVTTFDLESATANNAVAGQRIITLPAGNYDKLHFLATTGWDSFATGLSVTVTYADGSTTFPQGFSKWTATSTEPGETVVSTMTYSNVSNGTQNNAQVRVYGYTLTLDPTKQVVSFTTPNQGKVVVLGITLESAGSSAPSPVQVSLSGSYNRVGITANGSPFTGGLDNNGNAYSSTALTSTASWNGLNFALPTTSGNNVVSAAGQVIALPTGNYSALSFLATAVNANQLNQAFTVRYTDNSTQTFTQSLSSWTATQNVANEETAKVMTSRNTAAGGQDNTTVRLYGYSIVLNGAKRVQNIQLPNNGNVELLAITLTPSAPSPTMVSLTGSYNQVGIVNGAYTTTGLDENNRSYQYAGFFGGNDNPQYQGFLPWSGQAFPYTWAGANNTVNNVAYTHGQTITFPTGTYSGLSFLASAVNTDQLNQVFTVNYVGGSTRTFTQSLSNWLNPGTSQLYPNEARAVTLIKYVPPSGVAVNQNNYIYGYSIPLDGSKSVASITLPNNSNVKLIAINLTPASLPPSNPPQPAQQQVSLTYDRIGFVNDNQTFANNQGIDANGRALSANLLNASPISWSGATFNLGPATGNNVTYAHGQTVSFTAGNYSHLYFLATTSWDSYPAQTFTVNYATGAPVPVNLSFSIWTAPQSYTGEEQVLPMAYRNLSTGARDNTAVYLYGYTITIDPTRQVTSITLPNQGKINILAMTLV